jgi:hemolysin activation/secretion protein
MIPVFRRYTLLTVASCLALPLHAQVSPTLGDQELQRQQQRERLRQEQAEQRPDVRLMLDAPKPDAVYPAAEAPCSTIDHIVLQGAGAAAYQWALKEADGALGRCLGSAGMNVVVTRIQNALVAAGYVTTRVLAPAQDLKSGTLALVVVPGVIHAIRFADPAAAPGAWNIFPAASGAVLNLRDIEQALENFKRVPTVEADIQIAPGAQAGESDLVVQWQQQRRLRGSVSFDDSGGASTGKYQGGATMSVDNPFGLHDLFYLTLNHHIAADSAPGKHGTRGSALHYSVPYRYWLLALQASDYRYRQTVAGATQDYLYSGTSRNTELKLSRLMYRDASRKTTVSLQGWQRQSRNFIEDTEVEVQRRRTGGFTLGLAHKEFIGPATLDASVNYKRGTGAFGSLAAPEEAFGEGTARPVLFYADIAMTVPLAGSVQYAGSWRAQWNRTPLIPQDLFSIGGRYTVRGFDGESSLAAERGSLLRNEIDWNAGSGQLFGSLDAARVAGPGRERLRGSWLAGAAVGWRGQYQGLQYEFSLGRPLHKPDGFHAAAYARTFSLNHGF